MCANGIGRVYFDSVDGTGTRELYSSNIGFGVNCLDAQFQIKRRALIMNHCQLRVGLVNVQTLEIQ